ncbi:hypothetical protein CW304_18050 [Bacillus sp. UFRGS-B20]|nr:hypothetical protein CW304_18050 [Bacillus sp. UFRGS-B20]
MLKAVRYRFYSAINKQHQTNQQVQQPLMRKKSSSRQIKNGVQIQMDFRAEQSCKISSTNRPINPAHATELPRLPKCSPQRFAFNIQRGCTAHQSYKNQSEGKLTCTAHHAI